MIYIVREEYSEQRILFVGTSIGLAKNVARTYNKADGSTAVVTQHLDGDFSGGEPVDL